MSWIGPAISAGAGLIGGFFGQRKPKIPKELRRIYQFQMSMADQQRRFAQSTPLSDPREQAYLGQQMGFLGEQQQQQREQLGSLYNPLTMSKNAPNQLLNLGNQQIGQQMNLRNEALLSALQERRQALMSASGIAANAAGAAQYQQQPQYDMAGTFGGLAKAIALQRGMSPSDQGQGGFGAPGPVGDQSGWMATHGFGANQNVATTAGADRTTTVPFNPVGQVQGAQLPGITPGLMGAGPAQGASMPGITPGLMGGNAAAGGWGFADPRTRQFNG